MALLLDCETAESTLHTVAAAFGLDAEGLRHILDELLERTQARKESHHKWLNDKPTRALLRAVEAEVPHPPKFGRVCYFHLTRVKRGVDFSNGIRPADDSIWDTLEPIAASLGLSSLLNEVKRAPGEIEWRIRGKYGPFGHLVGDLAMLKEWKKAQYLDGPETIRHICDLLPRAVLETFQKTTEPRIVVTLQPCAAPSGDSDD